MVKLALRLEVEEDRERLDKSGPVKVSFRVSMVVMTMLELLWVMLMMV